MGGILGYAAHSGLGSPLREQGPRVIAKTLLGLFREAAPAAAPSGAAPAGDALTPGDRHALAADLSYADAVQPGLGQALLGFVLTGEGEAVLLQAEHLLQAPQPPKGGLRDALMPTNFPHGDDKDAQARRLEPRCRVLYGLEEFDAAVLRRYAMALASASASQAHRHPSPGSERSPAWFRRLLDVMDQYDRVNVAHLNRPLGFLTAPRIREMLALDGFSAAPLVDCLFVKGTIPGYSDMTTRHLALDGLAGVLAAEPEEVASALRAVAAPARAVMAMYFARNGLLDIPAFFEFAFTLAADGARVSREAGVAALGTAPAERVQARAAELLASASADDRRAAVNVLAARFGAAALPGLVAHEAGERSKRCWRPSRRRGPSCPRRRPARPRRDRRTTRTATPAWMAPTCPPRRGWPCRTPCPPTPRRCSAPLRRPRTPPRAGTSTPSRRSSARGNPT